MINFNFQKECYSCTACRYVCKKDAISFSNDLIPIIDAQKCIGCMACDKICIRNNEKEAGPINSKCHSYICKNKNNDKRLYSSSGGTFIALADYFLNNGGYVCGCIYGEKHMPKHIVSNYAEDVSKMMGSKYVQSDLGECISYMESILKEGYPVMFTGVPCQIAAVNTLLGKYDNIYLVSVICHGSIDRKIWAQFLEEERSGKTISHLTMRDKKHGWLNYGLKIDYSDGTSTSSYRNEDGFFLQSFTDGLMERDRCLACNYKGGNIKADILLGDAWGMDKYYPDFFDDIGVSSVLCMTSKGSSLFNAILPQIMSVEVETQKIIETNQRIVTSASTDLRMNLFRKEITNSKKTVHYVCKKYAKKSCTNRILAKIPAKKRR